MGSRDLYNVTYREVTDSMDNVLDTETEFNANRFKLYDDFTTDMRLVDLAAFRANTLFQDAIRDSDANSYAYCTQNAKIGDPDDSGVDMENGNPLDATVNTNDGDLLENEVMVDPWSSMESTASPLTESGPSASDDCTPSTSSETPRGFPDAGSRSPGASLPRPSSHETSVTKLKEESRPRHLTLDLEPANRDTTLPRRPHFLDGDYRSPSGSSIECRIPEPHFLDHTPSPDDFDEKSDITNPNFLDDDAGDADGAQRRSHRSGRVAEVTVHRAGYRSALHYGLDAARSSERDKRASQLYSAAHDTASVRSVSSGGSSRLDNKMECVHSLLSLLTLSPDNNAELGGPLLEMSRCPDSCAAMRQAGCVPLLVQLVHSRLPRDTRDRAAQALRNIIHAHTDDKAARREARVWRLLEQVRAYCAVLEDLVAARKEGRDHPDDDAAKHPSQCVAVLMKLSFDEEHRHVVCQLGGLQALATLVSNDQAAHGSRTDDTTCLTMRKYAGMTLTNLTFGDGNNKSLLCSFKDFMLALVEQLESPNDDMRQVTAAVLRNLSWRADSNSKQVLREVDAVRGLTKAAMTCQKEATLKSVLSALWNLTAHCSMNKVALCSVDGALGFLVDMLSYNSPTKTLAIVENAGGIVRNVSSHIAVREDYRQILRERNCLSVLLQHLKSPSLTVVSNTCGTLWNLSARCPRDQLFLLERKADVMLRSLIHSKHKMIAMGSNAALKNLINSKLAKPPSLGLDATARSMNLPALPTLGVRKQRALEQELDRELAETCDNIEPPTSPGAAHRDEKMLFTAASLDRHRTSLLRGALVQRSDSRDSVTSTRSERTARPRLPVPAPRNRDLVKSDTGPRLFREPAPPTPPVPPPRTATDTRPGFANPGYDVDRDPCDRPVDFGQKYSETETTESTATAPLCADGPAAAPAEPTKKFSKKGSSDLGDYQETDLDQLTDYSLRYAEDHSDTSEPAASSVHEDTIQHFCTEGTPYETPVTFSTATSMSDLRVIGPKELKPKTSNVKENPEVMTNSDEKDNCSIEDPPRPDNDKAAVTVRPEPVALPPQEKPAMFDTKFSSGTVSPEKPVNYCDEGTPGYFSRVSSLSSLGEPTEEDSLAKKNAMATINVDTHLEDVASSSVKDKEGSKAVTFATEPVSIPWQASSPSATSVHTSTPPVGFVEDTPLMFSRSSSLGSLPDCEQQDDHVSVISEVSRLTSGCISPSEIPDSPAHTVPCSPPTRSGPSTAPATPPHPEDSTVFAERVSQFVVENTPAHFSTATSLSELTIPDDNKPLDELQNDLDDTAEEDSCKLACDAVKEYVSSDDRLARNTIENDTIPANSENLKDTCRVYFTEDTPGLSKAGSNSDLSALSMDAPHLSSDSSNLSDGADLLEQCIQKGIDQVVKNKGGASDCNNVSAPTNPFLSQDGLYRSLPPYLRSSTETVKMSHEAVLSNDLLGSTSSGSPPPPLPPKSSSHIAPPRPPLPAQDVHGRSRLPMKTQRNVRDRPLPQSTSNLARNDSLSSLSLDSFGSTDREIFEQVVKVGQSSAHPHSHPRADRSPDNKHKSHSVERPADGGGRHHTRYHKSLDRGDKLDRHGTRTQHHGRTRRRDTEPGLTRSPYSYHGDSKWTRQREDQAHALDRSNSLSSLSNDSFGSTDKEVFERCVKVGMTKSNSRKRDDNTNQAAPRRRPRPPPGALDRMLGDEYSRDRALLQEVIARGAGERPHNAQAKNVPAPSAGRASADGSAANAPRKLPRSGCDNSGSDIIDGSGELPTVGSCDTTLESVDRDDLERSNECLAAASRTALDTTFESETKDELDRSNESCADVLDASWSEGEAPLEIDTGTLTRQKKEDSGWTDVDGKDAVDTWNDNTCLDDVTLPTVSGSVHMVSSIRSEVADVTCALPDLLEKSDTKFSGPDLTDRLDEEFVHLLPNVPGDCAPRHYRLLIDSIPEPSFTSLIEESDTKLDSLASSEIEKEAARLAALLKSSPYNMESSVTSLTSVDLDNVRPPSNMGSLLSLSTSGHWEELSSQTSKKSQKSRKKSLPVALMVRRALSNSMHRGSSEHLDSNPISLLDSVKPPSEMDNIDMEHSMVSVGSIGSEVIDVRRVRTPVVFDLDEPIQEFPGCGRYGSFYRGLDDTNSPSLFEELIESTTEINPMTAHKLHDDTLHVVTDIPSGSETCTPLPSDPSSAESTPKRNRNSKYLTPKEKRLVSKDRYQTYTLTEPVIEDAAVSHQDSEQYLTWSRSESEARSEEPGTDESRSRRRVSAKQRRQEDRARYQTQTVDAGSLRQLAELSQRALDDRKYIKQRRVENAERFRTRTLSDDIPPSPTFVVKDANFENVETTTGYDSLSSTELDHQLLDHHHDDTRSDRPERPDSGHNEDYDCLSSQLQTYTKSFRNYLPAIEVCTTTDICVVNNLKNIEMTESFMRNSHKGNPNTGDFTTFERSCERDDRFNSDSESDFPVVKCKPKITKPEEEPRNESLESNESLDRDTPKAVRGRKKAAYVSPYRRNVPKKVGTGTAPRLGNNSAPSATRSAPTAIKVHNKTPTKPQTFPKPNSANTSPKKTFVRSSPQRSAKCSTSAKPLPIERQGTFTKEESSVPAAALPEPRAPPTTSPSRLPQPNRFGVVKPPLKRADSNDSRSNTRQPARATIKSSASNHSLRSDDSGKTVTLSSKNITGRGSTGSVNSGPAIKTKEVESRIANLWRKVEQSKKQPTKPDKRVWIEGSPTEPPKLIRSSTFEGRPQTAGTSPPKHKSAIGMRVSQIPGPRGKTAQPVASRKPQTRLFTRKQVSGHS